MLLGNSVGVTFAQRSGTTIKHTEWDLKLGTDPQLLLDTSGNNRHTYLGSSPGTDVNDPTSQTYGLSFDGVNDYVALPSGAGVSAKNPVTVVIPLRIPASLTSGFPRILSQEGETLDAQGTPRRQGWLLFFHGGQRWIGAERHEDGTNSGIFTGIVNDGWHVLAYRYDGAFSTIFLDGAQAANIDDPRSISRTTGFDLGKRSNGSDSHMLMEAGSLYITHSALTNAEVLSKSQAVRDVMVARGVTMPVF